ncbi:hypothetical protein AU499_10260 [Lonsdalea populi]|nr:hypothetical protein AU499_10260 [Lonsdalea populi]RAT61197.1 hypothetical protein AU501_08545 [Lonsdalea populi]
MLSDWGICVFLEKEKSCYDRVCKHVRDFNPDMILLEQPFLWPLVERFFRDGTLGQHVKVIYSSHNIEVVMKRQIYRDLYSPEVAAEYTTYVDDLERGVIKACAGAIAVSELDADYISEVSPGTPVQIYFNGHSRPVSGSEDKNGSLALLIGMLTGYLLVAGIRLILMGCAILLWRCRKIKRTKISPCGYLAVRVMV